MKNILLKSFGIFIVVFSIFFINTDFSSAQNSTCNITGINIRTTKVINNPNGDADSDGETNWQEEFFNDEQRPFVYFDIQTTGCFDDLDDNYDMKFSLAERDFGINETLPIPQLDDWEIDVPSPGFTIAFLAGENFCDQGGGPDCEYRVEIDDNNSSGEEFGNLKYNCEDGCWEDWIYLDFLSYGALHPNDQNGTSTINDTTENTTCDVIDAKFRTNVVLNTQNGDFEAEFFQNNSPPYVYFDIKTTGCLDNNLDWDMELTLEMVNPPYYNEPITQLDNWQFDVPDNNFTIVYQAGNITCDIVYDPDCQYHIVTSDSNSSDDEWDNLQYNCDVSCVDFIDGINWNYLGFLPYEENYQYDGSSINPVPGTTTPTPGINESYLAPLPGLESASSGLQGFLQGLFNIAIVIAGILAILMIVIGAITYLSTDSLSGTEKGRDMMLNAVFGLILALGAWVILNTLNPNLAESLRITIPRVTLTEGDSDIYGSGPTSYSTGGVVTAYQLPNNIDFYCPGSGGASAIPQIVNSFKEKVAYRWGGKGGALPAGQNFPLSPTEVAKGPYMCENDSGQTVPCNTFCPSGNACLDCSGFINHVRACSGSTTYQTGTSGMVSHPDAEPVDMNSLNGNGTQIGSYVLVPGDILVWNGHVVVYYGNGKVAESVGGPGGRQKNGNINITNIKKYKDDITHILKIQ